MSLAEILANTGQWLGAPELKWSERLSGSNTQTRPNSLNTTGLLGSGGYIINPVSSNGNQTWPVSGGIAQGGPQQGQKVINDPTAPDYTTNKVNNPTIGGNNPTSGDNKGGGSGIDPVALADQARRNRINSAKSQARNLRSSAKSTFDDILKAVGAFRDRSKEQWSNAGQEIINTASNILGSNARTAVEASGDARARGRALGLGDSSKFNLQNKVQGNLASTQGNTIAKRGEEDRANQLLLQERNDQAQGQEDTANTYLKNANDRATTVENTGYDAGEEVFSNALNDIVNYQRSLEALRGNSVKADTLSQYAPNFNGITNTINGVLSGITGGQQGGTAQDAGNLANPVDIMNLLKRPKASAVAY